MSMMAKKGGFGTAKWRPVGNAVYALLSKMLGVMPFCWDPNDDEFKDQNKEKKEEFAGNFLEFSYLHGWSNENFTWIQSLVSWAAFFTSTKDWNDKLLAARFKDTDSDRQTRKRKPDDGDRLVDDQILAKATKVLNEIWNEERGYGACQEPRHRRCTLAVTQLSLVTAERTLWSSRPPLQPWEV